MNMLEKFLSDNSPLFKCYRTIVQGVIAAFILYLPDVFGLWHLDPVINSLLVAVVMAILSPIMAMLGSKDDEEVPDKDNE